MPGPARPVGAGAGRRGRDRRGRESRVDDHLRRLLLLADRVGALGEPRDYPARPAGAGRPGAPRAAHPARRAGHDGAHEREQCSPAGPRRDGRADRPARRRDDRHGRRLRAGQPAVPGERRGGPDRPAGRPGDRRGRRRGPEPPGGRRARRTCGTPRPASRGRTCCCTTRTAPCSRSVTARPPPRWSGSTTVFADHVHPAADPHGRDHRRPARSSSARIGVGDWAVTHGGGSLAISLPRRRAASARELIAPAAGSRVVDLPRHEGGRGVVEAVVDLRTRLAPGSAT